MGDFYWILENIIAAILSLSLPALDTDAPWKVIYVIDGDTVGIKNAAQPQEIYRLRLIDVDTPEKGEKARCAYEARAALAATNFTKTTIAKAQRIKVYLERWGKWDGTILGRIEVDDRDLSRLLLNARHARPYNGGRRGSWCS